MQLEQALRDISDIRRHIARGEVFRGYRSLTIGFSGVAGVIAAALQSHWVAAPEIELDRYLGLWVGVAAVSLVVAGAEMCWRTFRAGPGLARQHTLLAVEQFLPSIVVGALLTWCIYLAAPHVAWMLPGLWGMLFGSGILTSSRLLPRPALAVGLFYVGAGCGCLAWGQGEHALSPWLMGITFGGGQLIGAAVMYWTLERTDASPAGQ